MASGKVLSLYITIPDLMRSGHRMKVDDFSCDPNGIVGSRDYENDTQRPLVLVSKTSYDIIEEADFFLDQGILMEDIYVDVDLYHLQKGSIIEIGDVLFEVSGPCEDYRYLYTFAPEVPELIQGKRGLFITPVEYGTVEVGSDVTVVKEA
jgi:MOSC domain-containing protein YiiM